MAQEASSGSSNKSSPLSTTTTRKSSLLASIRRASDESSGSQTGGADQADPFAPSRPDTQTTDNNNKTTKESAAMRNMGAKVANQRAAEQSNEEPKQAVAPKTTAAVKEEKMVKVQQQQQQKQSNKKQKQKQKNTKRANKGDKGMTDNDTKTNNQPAADNINNHADTSPPKSRRDTNKPAVEQKQQKLLVDELKLFQNNHLLNQQDPIHQLHIQLNQLIKDDECNNNKRDIVSSAVRQSVQQNQLQASSMPLAQSIAMNEQQAIDDAVRQSFSVQNSSDEENIFTVRKGVLWQQQHHDKFHQRLFSRWKKRYFILTTDYLVCFKRSTPKVGRSEMGKFLYKTALSDVTKVERLKSKKSAIILHSKGQTILFLWCKENLDEWMFMISESIERIRIRRSCQIVQNSSSGNNLQRRIANFETNTTHPSLDIEQNCNDDLYENTAIIKSRDGPAQPPNQHQLESKTATESNKPMNKQSDNNDIVLSANSNYSQETRSQTITKHSKSCVHPAVANSANRRGSHEQQKTSVDDQKRLTEGGRNDLMESNKEETNRLESSSSQSVASSVASSGSNRAKNSIEHERYRDRSTKECADSIKTGIAQQSGDENRNSKIDNVQTGGRVGGCTMVIYDPTDNGSCSSTPRSSKSSDTAGGAKLSNQAEKSGDGGYPREKDGSPKILRTKHRNSSARRGPDELENQTSKESSSSSSSERLASNRSSKKLSSSLESSSRIIVDRQNSEHIGQVRERKRSGDSKRLETTSSSHSSPRSNANDNSNGNSNEYEEKKCNNNNNNNNNHSPKDSPARVQRQAAVATAAALVNDSNSVTTSTKSPQINANPPKNLENRPLPTPTTATTNLIRRDDSWQSLVSLTRVGKVTPVAMQVAQRSLYAQHIMPESNSDLTRYKQQQQQHMSSPSSSNRQHMINIESTITPSRGPFLRQQSAQSSVHGNRFRPLPPIGGVNANGHQQPSPSQQHAASFDLSTSSSPMPFNQRNNQTTSYQQKLLQLQLLHNSNNVDYIRHNNGDLSNDYQIYGPESTNGYGYGYSSMRSNLKSAASEFSFIRPSSSSQAQSTLPHPPNHHHQPSQASNTAAASAFVLDNRSTRQLPMRSSLVLASAAAATSCLHTASGQQPPPTSKQTTTSGYIEKRQSDSNNNDIGQCMSPMAEQFLMNSSLGERAIINQQQLQPANGKISEEQQQQLQLMGVGCELMTAPMRELPLKPNKKRAPNGGDSALAGNNLPKSSSLTSSIACFFRRAFSRRSKKKNGSKRRSKLAESCSSSLGAFEDGYASGTMVPSAFSTGSKSVDGNVGSRNHHNSNNKQAIQSPRMIDMIEAFTNKTLANEVSDTLGSCLRPPSLRNDCATQGLHQYHSDAFKANDFNNIARRDSDLGTLRLAANQQQQQINRNSLNQFGSPLHKSNSISATMGLSFANEQTLRSNASFLYDNAMMAASGGSPMLMRSSKVFNANLASQVLQHQQEFGLDHQPFLSPRNFNRRSEHLPRPSSIYGQPSMISSPVISREDRNSGNFGAHRNSLHNHNNFRERGQPPPGGFDIRRHHHQMMKVPYLDTTKEVAEELPSPSTESTNLLHNNGSARDLNSTLMDHKNTAVHNPKLEHSPSVCGSGRYLISASPSSGRLNHRQAIVNPILQSSTMGTIYDNHPMLNCTSSGQPELTTLSSSYSHYDNHNQLLMDSGRKHGLSNQLPSSPSLYRQQQQPQTKISGPPTASPRAHMNSLEDLYNHNMNVATTINQSQTPSHHRLSSSADINGFDAMRGSARGKKPSAIVAPSTPSHNPAVQNHFRNDICSLNTGSPPSPSSNHHQFNRAGPTLVPQSRSPMMSRRAVNQNHYQQSPLVSSQTRVLNKGDGVQATVSVNRSSDDDGGRMIAAQPVINIAGAPGINLEPSLAASLLKGTNIDAYECSTFDRLNSGQSQQNSKTFLVSTRLSKSMAYSHASSNENGSNTSIISLFDLPASDLESPR